MSDDLGEAVIDVLVTTYDRVDMLKVCLESILNLTRQPIRLFIADDGSTDGTLDFLGKFKPDVPTRIFTKKRNEGITLNFNLLMAESNKLNEQAEPGDRAEYVCYFQDDIRVLVPAWDQHLWKAFERYEIKKSIGFFSGYDCFEHTTLEKIPWTAGELSTHILVKKSSGMPNLIARRDFWNMMLPVPKTNPDGSMRGHPSFVNKKSIGSNLDLYLMGYMSRSRAVSCDSPNSLRRQRKYILVVNQLMEHMGQNKGSTWRK